MIDGRLSLRKLEIYCLVVELKSVSGAARALYMTQPAVTGHLRIIERLVGHQLISRSGRGFELTDAGRRCYDWSVETLSRARELDRQLDGLVEGSQGSASIGTCTNVGTYILPDMIAEFALARPKARVALVPSVRGSAIEGAVSGRFDFSVVAGCPLPPSAEVIATQIAVEPYVLVAAGDAEHVPHSAGAAELAALPFVCIADERPRTEFIDAPLQRAGAARRQIVLELGHPEAIMRAVERGIGVAFMLRAAVERGLASGRLREIATDVTLPVPISLVHRASRGFSPLQRELMATITEQLGRRGCELYELDADREPVVR